MAGDNLAIPVYIRVNGQELRLVGSFLFILILLLPPVIMAGIIAHRIARMDTARVGPQR
jgi:hypothetical protein